MRVILRYSPRQPDQFFTRVVLSSTDLQYQITGGGVLGGGGRGTGRRGEGCWEEVEGCSEGGGGLFYLT